MFSWRELLEKEGLFPGVSPGLHTPSGKALGSASRAGWVRAQPGGRSGGWKVLSGSHGRTVTHQVQIREDPNDNCATADLKHPPLPFSRDPSQECFPNIISSYSRAGF